jgi:hypothetical protein
VKDGFVDYEDEKETVERTRQALSQFKAHDRRGQSMVDVRGMGIVSEVEWRDTLDDDGELALGC